MNNNKQKSSALTFGRMLFKGAFVFNPVLTQAIGLCPIVAIAFSVKPAASLSLVLAFLLIVNEQLTCLFFRKFPRWLRVCCYLALSTAIVVAAMLIFESLSSALTSAMGIYLPLLSVNSLAVIRCEKFAVTSADSRPLKTASLMCFFDALSASIGYAAVILACALIRSAFASGSLFGGIRFSGMAMPFGGLLVLGFLAAFHKLIVIKIFPEENVNAFDLSKVSRKPLLVDPGLHATEGTVKLTEEPFTEKDKQRLAEEEAERIQAQQEAERLAKEAEEARIQAEEAKKAAENAPPVVGMYLPDAPVEVIPLPTAVETEAVEAVQETPDVQPEESVTDEADDPFIDYSFEYDEAYSSAPIDLDDADALVAIPIEETDITEADSAQGEVDE